jgi:flagellar hook protein FlgE
VPLASFPNANGLRSETGNIFNQTDSSGEFSLSEIGDAGVGNIVSSALENANVELADELTDLVIAQRAFQSNTRVITTVDELLEELNRISG